jgi:glycerophosphoryl diester phosphodiesterase
MTLAEVRALDCGRRVNPRFPDQTPVAGERVPTLQEVLDLVRGAGRPVRVDLELKSAPAYPDRVPALDHHADLVAAALKGAGPLPGLVVLSFDHRLLAAVKARLPDVAVSPLVPECLPDLAAIAHGLHAAQISPHHEWVTAADVAALHAAGVRVVPWTANDASAWARLVALGVDGIITDDPAGLIEFLRARGAR